MYYYNYETMLGSLYISADDDYLLEISISKPEHYELKETEIIRETMKQIDEYLKRKRKVFNLPLNLRGSVFELKVYKSMIAVEFGALSTYKGLAEASESPKAYRAVGSVCAKNPYPIVVPCHRILKADHHLGGYALGDEMKIKLLEIEGHSIENKRVL